MHRYQSIERNRQGRGFDANRTVDKYRQVFAARRLCVINLKWVPDRYSTQKMKIVRRLIITHQSIIVSKAWCRSIYLRGTRGGTSSSSSVKDETTIYEFKCYSKHQGAIFCSQMII